MADTKISAMTNASALGGTEQIAGVQTAANVNITPTQVKTFIIGAGNVSVASGKTLTASFSGTLGGGDAWTLAIAAAKTLTVSNGGTIAGGDSWSLAIAASKTLTVSNILTLAGTDSTVMTFPSTSATIARTDAANSFAGVQTVASGTATPAAGSAAAVLLFGTTAGFGIYYGSNAPTVSAGQGSLYLRSNGTGVADRAYINTTGSTTWTSIATAG